MTMNPNSTVVGVFSDRAMAEQAIEALQNAGFSGDQIRYSGRGTAPGGFLDTIKSLFTGDTSSSAVAQDLVNFGVGPNEAQYYANEYESGRSIVAVRPDGNTAEAMNVLRSSGAYDYRSQPGYAQTAAYTQASGYNQQANTYGQTDYTQPANYAQSTDYAQSAGNYGQGDYRQPDHYAQTTDYTQQPATEYADTEENRNLKLREERLRAEKQPVQTGEAVLHKEVIPEEKTITVPVTREEVYLEQRPVAEGQPADAPITDDEEIRIPVHEERVNVSKETVVTGEVGVGKRQVQDERQYTDTVRREQARVERSGNANIRSSDPNLTTDPADTDPNND